MADKEWSTLTPATQDVDPITTAQPDVINIIDNTRATQILTLRDKLHNAYKAVGTDDLLPKGSVRAIVSPFGDEIWLPYPTTNPVGVATPPTAIYDFDGSGSTLLDRTANGHNLSLTTGTTRHIQLAQNLMAFAFDGASYLETAVHADFITAGALTFELTLLMFSYGLAENYPALLGGASGAADIEVNNDQLRLQSSASDGIATLKQENAVGNDNIQDLSTLWPIGKLMNFTLTRELNGTDVSWYQNGLLRGTASLANAPTGGANSRIRLGELFRGAIVGLRYTKGEAFTAGQVLAAHQYQRGVIA
jgi:hypothetical protein